MTMNISNSTKPLCSVCKMSDDVRPYAEGSKLICFDCAQKPEFREVVSKAMDAHLNGLDFTKPVYFFKDALPSNERGDGKTLVAEMGVFEGGES